MQNLPQSLSRKLEKRRAENATRTLNPPKSVHDFSSNDYLGFAHSKELFDSAHQLLVSRDIQINGATGSRLISGNYALYEEAEMQIAAFHHAEAALIFNSGYDANLGFFGSVPQRGEVVLYDELCHASIREGLLISAAKSVRFPHNDCHQLERLIHKFAGSTIYIVTEAVFSMDGDCAPIHQLVALAEKHQCYLIVDEAHAFGVLGERGEGLVQSLQLENRVFARVVTFGKALGCHGAAIVGSESLKSYLINFARSFIYTTGLPPQSVATILMAYKKLDADPQPVTNLREMITCFNAQKKVYGLRHLFVESSSAIHCAIIPGNEQVKALAEQLTAAGFGVKAILSPTVPAGQERLRLSLHSYTSRAHIHQLLELLRTLVPH